MRLFQLAAFFQSPDGGARSTRQQSDTLTGLSLPAAAF